MTEDQPERSGEVTTKLSDFITGLSYDDIPEEALELERWHILDTLGCILYGATTPWVRKVVAVLEEFGETGEASALGTDATFSPARASLVNGTASHSMDYDDYCQDAGVHAGSATVTTALAHAETADEPVTGRELLTAVTAGVETSIRTGYGIGRGSLLRGWHIAGWTGAFGAAATTGSLLNLSQQRMNHALGLAGTQGAGLMGAAYGSEVKRFHMGKAAESGYLGAALAAHDFTGDTRIFEERWGSIGTTMSEDYDADAVTYNLGDEYELLEKLSFKPYPSTGQVHPPADAVKQILHEQNITGEDIERVVIRVTEAAKEKAGWEFEPLDVMSAQANMQYAIGALLVDGEVTLESYTREAIQRPEVLEAIDELVEIVVDDSLEVGDPAYARYNTVVEITTHDEETFTAEKSIPRGFPQNPMSEEELTEKFRQQAAYALDSSAIEDCLDFVLTLEDHDDVSELFNIIDRGRT
jgi:2-methylcitrate dehydratase PrpD